MTCNGSGWRVYEVDGEAHHDVCYGCSDCDDGWCHEHGWALNICLMDHLEAGEAELVAALCGEEFEGEDLALLLSYGTTAKPHVRGRSDSEEDAR